MSVHIRFGASGKLCRLKPTRHQLGEECNATANFATASFTDPRIRASIRHALADEIDRLLNLIDALDDDPDLEPELGWSSTQAHGTADDREDDAGDGRELDEDREPILGWTETHDQTLPSRMAGGAWDEDEDNEQEPQL
ncbi:hypothetical protein [Aureimonas psammosilenae]|uniref:hypothetical protein n=1 Tax=Aureimonas psammosilenae TaxID=2495496 RepID=UPI001260D4CB|nr:hypothetical protein [Aureimonas psammosilenae]